MGALLTMALLLALLPAGALAIDPIDLNQKCTLTVNCTADDQPLTGMQLRLYRVADTSDFAVFTPVGDFAAYPVLINDLDSEGWRKAAKTLAAFAEADTLAPLLSTKIGATGAVRFRNLRPGLYLLVSDTLVLTKRYYEMDPLLIALPYHDPKEHQWTYDVTVDEKCEGFDRDLTSVTAMKVWKDTGWTSTRPTSVTVNLIGNGKVVDTVTLSKSNNWRHTWSDLDAAVTWRVIEKPVPTNYTVTVDRDKTLFTITNTRPAKTTTSDTLPQTGVEWWPVALLSVSGMALFFLGWLRRRQDEDDEEA